MDLHQVSTLHSAVDEAGAVDVLVGVVDRDGGGRRAVLPSSLEPGVDQLVAKKRARTVVDDDEIRRILAQALQA